MLDEFVFTSGDSEDKVTIRGNIFVESPDWFYDVIRIKKENGIKEKLEDVLIDFFSFEDDPKSYELGILYKNMTITITQTKEE